MAKGRGLSLIAYDITPTILFLKGKHRFHPGTYYHRTNLKASGPLWVRQERG